VDQLLTTEIQILNGINSKEDRIHNNQVDGNLRAEIAVHSPLAASNNPLMILHHHQRTSSKPNSLNNKHLNSNLNKVSRHHKHHAVSLTLTARTIMLTVASVLNASLATISIAPQLFAPWSILNARVSIQATVAALLAIVDIFSIKENATFQLKDNRILMQTARLLPTLEVVQNAIEATS